MDAGYIVGSLITATVTLTFVTAIMKDDVMKFIRDVGKFISQMKIDRLNAKLEAASLEEELLRKRMNVDSLKRYELQQGLNYDPVLENERLRVAEPNNPEKIPGRSKGSHPTVKQV